MDQVGVKAPGSPTIMTFFPAQESGMLIVLTSGNPCNTSTLGREVSDDIFRLIRRAANFDALVKLVDKLVAASSRIPVLSQVDTPLKFWGGRLRRGGDFL